MLLLHFRDWNHADKYYEVPGNLLVDFKDTIRRFGIISAWRWFTDQVDYSPDGSWSHKPIKRVNDPTAHPTAHPFFLDWTNPMGSIKEWSI